MKELIIFAVGAAIGSVITAGVLKNKYEQMYKEEIESVKETFSKRTKVENIKEEEAEKPVENKEADLSKYKKVLEQTSYIPHVESEHPTEGLAEQPYTITPDDFNKPSLYKKEFLDYYDEDEVLADEAEEVLFAADTIGIENLDKFGEHEPDVVHVRNERLMTEYEVTCIHSSYARMTGGLSYED